MSMSQTPSIQHRRTIPRGARAPERATAISVRPPSGSLEDRQAEGQLHPVVAEPSIRRLLVIGAAAEYLSVSRATIERLVFRGELPMVKVGGSTRYEVGDLDEFIEINRRRNRKRMA
jgi:excisionase family DNA binding protein